MKLYKNLGSFDLDVYPSRKATEFLVDFFVSSWSNNKYRRVRPGRGIRYPTYIPLTICGTPSKYFLCLKISCIPSWPG